MIVRNLFLIIEKRCYDHWDEDDDDDDGDDEECEREEVTLL